MVQSRLATVQRVASSGGVVEREAAVDLNQGKCNDAQMGKNGPLAAALGRISHPGILHHLPSLFPAAWSYKQCIITYQQTIRSAVITFVSNGPVFGCVCFLRDQQHATHPSAAKLYTCLMITHMYDENNDLDMSNVFFNEPVLYPVGVGAG